MQILIKSSIIIIYTIYIELKQSIENLTKVISSVYAEVINLKKENKEIRINLGKINQKIEETNLNLKNYQVKLDTSWWEVITMCKIYVLIYDNNDV